MEAGEYHLTAIPYDVDDVQGEAVTVMVDIRANGQRDPIFDEDVVLDVVEWKDIIAWQDPMRDLDMVEGLDPGDDYVTPRPSWESYRLAAVTYFRDFVYIVAEHFGTIYRVRKDDDANTTSGLELFLDVRDGVERPDGGNSTLGLGSHRHSGLRSVALHPNGTNRRGRLYVACMETTLTDDHRDALGPKKLRYIETYEDFDPIGEESVVIEFRYRHGKGIPRTYRLLFRIECKVIDHTIRQIGFRDKILYILHGDGSVESSVVGDAQRLDGLGKIYAIDPLDGTDDIEAPLEWGQYSTAGNPFDYDDEDRPLPGVPRFFDVPNRTEPNFGPVPKETYALGFRNAHTMTFTDAGDFIVEEIGRDTFEEINVIVPGGNYGWPYLEGTWNHTQLPDYATNGMFYDSRPATDEDLCPHCQFRWPAVQVGHVGYEGMRFQKIAFAGGHVVENDSDVHKAGRGGSGKYFYCDFPMTGRCMYSYVDDLLQTQETALGALEDHNFAPMYHARFRWDGRIFETFRDVLAAMNNTMSAYDRIDLRIGRDADGTMYILSKFIARIFKITNSVPPPPGR